MNPKKYIPLGNKILVKRSDAEVSKGGILLPESAQEKPKQGDVLAVGPGKIDLDGNTIPMNIKINEKVVFAGFAGTEVNSDEGEELLILSEDDVLAVVE